MPRLQSRKRTVIYAVGTAGRATSTTRSREWIVWIIDRRTVKEFHGHLDAVDPDHGIKHVCAVSYYIRSSRRHVAR